MEISIFGFFTIAALGVALAYLLGQFGRMEKENSLYLEIAELKRHIATMQAWSDDAPLED